MDRVREVVTSAAFAFVAGLALWPPRAVYWNAVVPVLGEGVTLALVGAVALGLGAAFGRVSRVAVRRFLAGGVVAYAVGMVAIETVLSPDSPAHLVLYGGLLGCLVVGVTLATAS